MDPPFYWLTHCLKNVDMTIKPIFDEVNNER